MWGRVSGTGSGAVGPPVPFLLQVRVLGVLASACVLRVISQESAGASLAVCWA